MTRLQTPTAVSTTPPPAVRAPARDRRRGRVVTALLFATDYPHSEGTFPFSQSVIQKLIDENPDVSTDELVAVLGGNAAKLFSRANLKPQVDARRAELAAA